MSDYDPTKVPCFMATDLFFGPEADLRLEPKDEKAAREQAARDVCETCDIKWECLSTTLYWEAMQEDKEERFGVWGGFSPGDRRDFVRWIKWDIAKLWREGVADIDYLEEEAEAFRWAQREERREREEAKQARRQAKEEVPPVVVSINTGRGSSRSRSVSSGNRSGGRAGQPSPVRAKGNNGSRATPKAASPKRVSG